MERKNKQQEQFVSMLQDKMAALLPFSERFDFTLTKASAKDLAIFFNEERESARLLAANVLPALAERPYRREFRSEDTVFFLTCFSEKELYFLSMGTWSSKMEIQIDSDLSLRLNREEILSIKALSEKSFAIHLKRGGTLPFSYHLGGTYSVPDGEKTFLAYLKTF